jgi:hypothetical protein
MYWTNKNTDISNPDLNVLILFQVVIFYQFYELYFNYLDRAETICEIKLCLLKTFPKGKSQNSKACFKYTFELKKEMQNISCELNYIVFEYIVWTAQSSSLN